MQELDHTDSMILEILQQDGRISNAELAKRIHLSPAATHARLRRLENENFIEGYGARVNHKKLGYNMLCYIHISLQVHSTEELDKFRDGVRDMSEVLECNFVTGDFDYLLKVALKDQQDLERFILRRLVPLAGVSQVNTSLIVAEVKSTSIVPVFDKAEKGK